VLKKQLYQVVPSKEVDAERRETASIFGVLGEIFTSEITCETLELSCFCISS